MGVQPHELKKVHTKAKNKTRNMKGVGGQPVVVQAKESVPVIDLPRL